MKQRRIVRLNLIVVLLFLICGNTLQSQVYTNKEVALSPKFKSVEDSLKKTPYPFILPILGAKAQARGYELPYSAGVSVNYFWQESDLIISNLMVGFNNNQMYNLDGLVRFDKAKSTASAITVRPDIWILPFLNVYGILGQAHASTQVGFGVWVPDSTDTPQMITHAESTVEFTSTTIGFGMTPTIGVAGGWIALDMNFAWTDVPQLSKPAQSFIFGPRFGKTFRFKRKDQNLAVWVGGFRVGMKSGTDGSISLSDVFSGTEFGSRAQAGAEKVDAAQNQVDTWWAGLTPIQQAQPSNKAKYEAANAVLDRAGNFFNQAIQAADKVENSTVQYTMDKRPADAWNFIVGSQYQFNKHFMLRGEVGFLASRFQVMTSFQYRFGL